MKKLLVVPALLAKAHVNSYTKKDGTVVQAHDTSVQAATPKPPILQDEKQKDRLREAVVKWGNKEHGQYGSAWMRQNAPDHLKEHYNIPHEHAHAAAKEWFPTEEEQLAEINAKKQKPVGEPAASPKMVLPKKAPAADPYGHPNVVGKAEKLQGGAADKAHGFHFAGKQFSATGKSGTSHHDGTPVRHFKEVTESGADDGQHLWMDHSARVHADASSEVKGLRAQYEAHAKKPAGGAMGPDEVKQHAVAAGAKFRSNVSVFSKPELAHSFANQTQGSKGSAFVMKHPDHQHHVVVGGADAQRMEKNGYQHVRPGA